MGDTSSYDASPADVSASSSALYSPYDEDTTHFATSSSSSSSSSTSSSSSSSSSASTYTMGVSPSPSYETYDTSPATSQHSQANPLQSLLVSHQSVKAGGQGLASASGPGLTSAPGPGLGRGIAERITPTKTYTSNKTQSPLPSISRPPLLPSSASRRRDDSPCRSEVSVGLSVVSVDSAFVAAPPRYSVLPIVPHNNTTNFSRYFDYLVV